MDEGTKKEEKELEELTKKGAIKEIKKAEKVKQKAQASIPEGVPKIKEIYTNVEKDEKIKCETEREERLHEKHKKRKRKRKTTLQ